MARTRKPMYSSSHPSFVFSRTVGVKHWSCPACNSLNRTHISAFTWLVQCQYTECRMHWAIGEVFYQLYSTKLVPPPDTIVSDEPYRIHANINRALCDGCARVLYQGFARDMGEEKTTGALGLCVEDNRAKKNYKRRDPETGRYITKVGSLGIAAQLFLG